VAVRSQSWRARYRKDQNERFAGAPRRGTLEWGSGNIRRALGLLRARGNIDRNRARIIVPGGTREER
jgi:hypothetical protein